MTDLAFPDVVVVELKAFFEDALADEQVVVLTRSIIPTDPPGTIAVFASDWEPAEHNIGQHEPALSHYGIKIQTMTKNTDEEEGRLEGSTQAKSIRRMLYRDTDLRVRLGQLSENDGEALERTLSWKVVRQSFLSNELGGQFLFLSVTDVMVRTQTDAV